MKSLFPKPSLALVLAAASAIATPAQTPLASAPTTVQTFYLTNVSQPTEVNEILTGIRNTLDPEGKIYLVPSQNAIIMRARPDQIDLARKLLLDLDRPRKTYRLTFTVTEMEAGKRIGVQRSSAVIVPGARTLLKQGSRVPIATGSYTAATSSSQTQLTYLDIGLNIDSTLDESANGVKLHTKVEQSSVAEELSSLGKQDPIIRQTLLEGTSALTVGKSVLLGAIDVSGSTRHLDVEVVLDIVR